jgi:hypothetical protein
VPDPSAFWATLVTPTSEKGVENFAVIWAEHVIAVYGAIGTEGWHVEDGPIKGRREWGFEIVVDDGRTW